MHNLSDVEAIRDTIKIQLTMCCMRGRISNHDVYWLFHFDHIASIIIHR